MMRLFMILAVFTNLTFAQTHPSESVFNLKSNWKNQKGKILTLRDLGGQKIIIAMVYTKCPHACPMTISKIQEIEKQLSQRTKEPYKIVMASFDPARDTPEHLKEYMKKRGVNEERWTFLSAPNDSTARELAVVLGINYKALDDGEFSHSNVISVLDARGVRIAKIETLSAPIDSILSAFSK